MKKKTDNPDFEYEISCDQMCGKGHYTMRGIVKVVTADEFKLWRAKQKPNYAQVMKDKLRRNRQDSGRQYNKQLQRGSDR